MPVSLTSSKVIFNALKQCDIRMLSALPETWLVHLIHMAEEDPDVILVRLAKEEEGVGISAGAYFAGVKSATKSRLSRSASGRRKRLRKAACNLSLFY